LPVIAIALFFCSIVLSPLGTVQSAGYDVSVSGKDITIHPTSPYAGDLVDITVVVKNNGTTANNVAVAFYFGATLVDNKLLPVVSTSETAIGQWNTTGLGPGTYKINITLVAQGDSNTTNNNASANILLKKKPMSILVIESLRVSPTVLVDGVLAYINGTVRNDGDANATLDANFVVDNGTAVKKPLVISVGETKIVSIEWNTTGKEGNHMAVLTAGPAKKTSYFTVGHRPQAVIEVQKVWISDKKPTEGRPVTVTAEVKNIGDAAEMVIVVFKDNTKTYAKSKPTLFNPGDEHNVSTDWTAGHGAHVLRVEVQGHPEAMNFYMVSPTALAKSTCGLQTIMPGVAIIVGCVGLVRWKGQRRRRMA
jgi:hypothetical protein